MTRTRTRFHLIIRCLRLVLIVVAALGLDLQSARAVVKVFDGFGDADRNNDGQITGYDTDLNDSGTFNQYTGVPPNATGPDSGLANRGIVEVTAAQDPSDVGIVWSGIRSYDTAPNLAKSKLRIINDDVATGVESTTDIFHHGLALGVESRGSTSTFIGKFGQSVALGSQAGDKVVASFDWRVWRESANNDSQPGANNSLRWGLYQDTDGEFGQTANYGDGWFNNGGGASGAPVVWGRDDGKWFDSSPGAEGDKGINTELSFGAAAPTTSARIRWETNATTVTNGDNGRILEGTNDTSTIASPPGNGTGGIITDLSSYVPHNLKLEITRLANGLVEVATFVDNTELLRDSVKTTDTNYSALEPLPFTYDYVAFRNGGAATTDYDYVIDNFKVEVFGSNAGVTGDYNGDGKVDAADYVAWRMDPAGHGGTPDGYNAWRANFGVGAGGGTSVGGGAVPEPTAALLVLLGGLTAIGSRTRRFGRVLAEDS